MPFTPELALFEIAALGRIGQGLFGIDQAGQLLAQGDQAADEMAQGQIVFIGLPMHPAQGVVLAPGVVVASLAAFHLVPHQQHRHPGG